MIDRRRRIEKSYYAERRYLTYKQNKRYISALINWIKWKWYERR